MKITNINNIKSNLIKEKNEAKSNIDFKKVLMNSINKLDSYEKEANQLNLMLATGEIDNIHDVMIASQKSEIALQFGIEIRNKIMDAYKEIMRIQI